jgi:hypothetical protein
LCVYHPPECETYVRWCIIWQKNKWKLMTVCPKLFSMCQVAAATRDWRHEYRHNLQTMDDY